MPWDSCLKLVNGTKVATLDCVTIIFSNLQNALLAFAGVTALFFIIYGGIKFILSGGDAKQVEGARKTLTYAIIGLLLILFSIFILNIISQITGVGCIRQFGFTNCQTSTPSNAGSNGSWQQRGE